jgi:alkylhydroperoxidase family enzyme
LEDRDRTMLEYVEKLTLRPVTIGREDIEVLCRVGFDDTAILQINLLASWFNYINRVADGLGVGRV